MDFSDGLVVTSLGADLPSEKGISNTQLPAAAANGESAAATILPTPGATSILTPLPSREPDMSRLARQKQDIEPMTMSPAQSLEETVKAQ